MTSIINKPKWYEELSATQVAILDSHLLQDQSIPKLAQMLQEEWGLSKGTKRESVVKAIQRYKIANIIPQQAKIVTSLGNPHNNTAITKLLKATQAVEEFLDPVNGLRLVVEMQMARVNKLAKVEDKLPTLMDAQTKNLQLLADMLTNMTRIQLEIGLIKRVATKIEFSSDVTEEQQSYVDGLTIMERERDATVAALHLLRQAGAIDVEVREQHDDDNA
jgi:hypothetical protein